VDTAGGQPITYTEMVELPEDHKAVVEQSGVEGMAGLPTSYPSDQLRSGDEYFLITAGQLFQLNSNGTWTTLVLGFDFSVGQGAQVGYAGYGSGDPILYVSGFRNHIFAFNITTLSQNGTTLSGNNTLTSNGIGTGTGLATTNGSTGFSIAGGSQLYSINLGSGATTAVNPLGQLNGANADAFGPNGLLYVLDGGNNRVAIFNTNLFDPNNPTSINNTLVGSFSLMTGGSSGIGIAVGPSGNVYVATGVDDSFQAYTAAGGYLGSFSPPEGAGFSPTGDGGVPYINTDREGNIYVEDPEIGLAIYNDASAIPEPADVAAVAGLGALVAALASRRRGNPNRAVA